MLITYRLADIYNVNAQIMVTAVAGLFILPFFIFSSISGEIAEKYEKSFLIRIIKFVEIVLMVLTAFAFNMMEMWSLTFLLFCMGAQSTFFSPLKYSVLPQLLDNDELIAGNGLVSASTNIAILAGTLCGGLLILSPLGRIYISVGIIGVAAAGFAASLFVPIIPSSSKEIKISFNIVRTTWKILAYPMKKKDIMLTIFCSSWFWFIGSVFLAQFPSYTKYTIGGNEQVSTFFIVVFSVGVAFGAMLCNKLLKGRISGKYLPHALAGMSVFIVLLYLASFVRHPAGTQLIGIFEFIGSANAVWIVISFFLLFVCGGLYKVPIDTIMQKITPPEYMSRVIAANNVVNSFAMVLAALICALLIGFGISIPGLFLITGALNIMMMPFILKLARGNYE